MNVADAICQFGMASEMYFGGCQQVYFPVFYLFVIPFVFDMAFIVCQFVPYVRDVCVLLESHVGRHAFDMIGLRCLDQQEVEQ